MEAPERIGLTRESRKEPRLLGCELMGSKTVLAKLYHAMRQSRLALVGIADIGRRAQADVIERFEKEHVGAPCRAYDLTHECDCDHMPVPTDENIAAAQRAADDLPRMAAALARNGGDGS